MHQQLSPELLMDEIGEIETLEQGLVFFEIVGVPARNLSTRTRKAYHHDVHNCLILTFVAS
jgi:hypothetical protein